MPTFNPIITEMRALFMMLMKLQGRELDELLRSGGININPIQAGILRLISAERKTISDMSKAMMLDPSTLVPLVDDLESKGLIERMKDPTDRRRVPLQLTPDGQAVMEKLQALHARSTFAQVLGELDPHDLQQLLRILRGLVARLPEGELMLCELDEQIHHGEAHHEAAPKTRLPSHNNES
jgi:DNA-binding MarR family transcriptional regulator